MLFGVILLVIPTLGWVAIMQSGSAEKWWEIWLAVLALCLAGLVGLSFLPGLSKKGD